MADELLELLAATVARSGLEVVDLEVHPGRVRVVVDAPGGAPLDAIAEATRSVSALLDAHDPLPGQRYTLEVSSPGVERPLRTPEQFARAVGETVSVRTLSGDPGTRRVTGRLQSVDDDGFVVRTAPDSAVGDEGDGAAPAERRFAFEEVERARTVFEWGPAQAATGVSRGRRAATAATDGRPRRAAARRGGRGTNRKMTTS